MAILDAYNNTHYRVKTKYFNENLLRSTFSDDIDNFVSNIQGQVLSVEFKTVLNNNTCQVLSTVFITYLEKR